ncbi:MAG: hypothetical protein WCP79_13240 [Bacillota bacterium]
MADFIKKTGSLYVKPVLISLKTTAAAGACTTGSADAPPGCSAGGAILPPPPCHSGSGNTFMCDTGNAAPMCGMGTGG